MYLKTGGSEYYITDCSGRELAVFEMLPGGFNRYGTYTINGLGGVIGRIESGYELVAVPDTNLDGPAQEEQRFDRPVYYLTDHLGSVRAAVNKNSETVFAQDTWPYGAVLRGYETGAAREQKIDFTGKQRDRETGLHNFGARCYSSPGSIWYSADPLADKYFGLSPYNYCANNPISMN